jgi:flavin reductase (DIM6/NTAB) family NADH-FMN oxidoreductase RutF
MNDPAPASQRGAPLSWTDERAKQSGASEEGKTTGPGAPEASGTSTASGVSTALASFATGVTLLMVADGRDDIGTTVSAFCPVSWSPPLVAVSLMAGSYPAEVLGRVGRFAVTMLTARQRVLAGRFAAAGRPGARLLLEGTPHRRGEVSGALIPGEGLAALECEAVRRLPAGDHLLVIASVLAVPYVSDAGDPLIRFAGRYPALR